MVVLQPVVGEVEDAVALVIVAEADLAVVEVAEAGLGIAVVEVVVEEALEVDTAAPPIVEASVISLARGRPFKLARCFNAAKHLHLRLLVFPPHENNTCSFVKIPGPS